MSTMPARPQAWGQEGLDSVGSPTRRSLLRTTLALMVPRGPWAPSVPVLTG